MVTLWLQVVVWGVIGHIFHCYQVVHLNSFMLIVFFELLSMKAKSWKDSYLKSSSLLYS